MTNPSMSAAEYKALANYQPTLEDMMLEQILRVKLPPPEREYRFWPGRKFRFDFAWVQHNIAVECEGGTFVSGRHVRGVGFENDCIKYNEAAVRGWTVLRVTKALVKSGLAIDAIERAFGRDDYSGGAI